MPGTTWSGGDALRECRIANSELRINHAGTRILSRTRASQESFPAHTNAKKARRGKGFPRIWVRERIRAQAIRAPARSDMKRHLNLELIVVTLVATWPQVAKSDPVKEFVDGKVHTFATRNHAKAKGIDLTISYPSSWAAEEGERPNIVQKFVSEQGHGLELGLILIMDLPGGSAMSIEEQRSALAPDELRDMLPEGATFLNAKPTKIEGLPAGIVEYSMQMERAGMELFIHAWSIYFIHKDALVSVQFQVTGQADSRSEISDRMTEFRPLFSLIANSIVLPQLWTQPASGESSPAPQVIDRANDRVSFDDRMAAVKHGLNVYYAACCLFLACAAILRYSVFRRPLSTTMALTIAGSVWVALLAIHQTQQGRMLPFTINTGVILGILMLKSGRKTPSAKSLNVDGPQ